MKQPYINESFEGAIWRLEVDDKSETLLIEVRDPADKKVSFASLNLGTGKINFKNFTTNERWLTGLEAAWDNVLLIHNYLSASGPEHKGLVAINALTSATLWENYIYAFDHLSINGPVVYDKRINPVKLLLADIKTGLIKRAYEPTTDVVADNHIIVPEILSVDFLKHLSLSDQPFGDTLHYLELNNIRVVSLHTILDGKLQQELYIMFNNDIIYHDLLNTDIQKMQPESFVVHNNRLIYIKNKSEIKVLKL